MSTQSIMGYMWCRGASAPITHRTYVKHWDYTAKVCRSEQMLQTVRDADSRKTLPSPSGDVLLRQQFVQRHVCL